MIRLAIAGLLAVVIPLGTAWAQWDAPKDKGEVEATSVANEPYDDPVEPESKRWSGAAGTVFPAGRPQSAQTAPSRDREPPTLLHDKPAGHEQGRPLKVLVNALDRSGLGTVTLHWRAAGQDAFRPVEMTVGAMGLYETDLPPSATGGMWLDYYVEAVDTPGNGPARLGSPQEPLRVQLHQSATAGSMGLGNVGVGVGLLAACFALASIVLKMRDRAQRARAEDEIYWARTLVPLLGLKGSAFTQAVTRLTRTPMIHPVLGVRRYTRADILEHLERVKRMNLERVANRAEKYAPEARRTRAHGPEERARKVQPPTRRTQGVVAPAKEPAGVH